MPKNKACNQCLLWWYAKKLDEQRSHEVASRTGYKDLGKWAGYSRWMSGRRAQEVQEMTLSEYIEREYVSEVAPILKV